MSQMDIKEEFDVIFGVKTRPNLFDADDTEYQQLRQQIINTPKGIYDHNSLPFENISLYSYEEYKVRETIEATKKKGVHLFYIKEYEGRKPTHYAVGYFRVKDSLFVVLKDSFFKTSNYFVELSNSISDSLKKAAFLNSFRFEGEVIFQHVQKNYLSASLAASYILGRKTSFREWRDENGKSLDSFYPLFKSDDIDTKEDKTFPNYVEPNHIGIFSNHHKVFFIKRVVSVERYCKASGYYDPITRNFVVLSGSILSLDMAISYEHSPAGIIRKRILEKFCAKEDQGYRLLRDHICNSPSSAAALVMGASANGWEVWKDDNGNSLDMIYRQSEQKQQLQQLLTSIMKHILDK